MEQELVITKAKYINDRAYIPLTVMAANQQQKYIDLLTSKDAEVANKEMAEKHIPTIEIENENRFVRLKYHPMVPEHHIQFIEVFPKDKSRMYLKYLNPNEPAEFEITHFEENIEALEHCNIHGLWKMKSE